MCRFGTSLPLADLFYEIQNLLETAVQDWRIVMGVIGGAVLLYVLRPRRTN